MNSTDGQLVIPALRAKMGDWTYYVTILKMRDIAKRVKVAEEIHPNKALSELIQRILETGHSEEIRDYLLMDDQRLFNAMVIGVYGGQPQWFELEIRHNYLLESVELPEYLERSIGILILSGTEDLFAIDG